MSDWKLTNVFDTETTGLLKPDGARLEDQPRIIEFGITQLDSNYKVVREANWLINPGVELPPEITKITGLTDKDLKDKPSFIEVLPEIIEIFLGVDRVVAHNLPFDWGMLTNELKRIGAQYRFPYPPQQVCTVQLSQDLVYGRRARMVELYRDTLGHELAQTHRALDDVHALVEIITERKW